MAAISSANTSCRSREAGFRTSTRRHTSRMADAVNALVAPPQAPTVPDWALRRDAEGRLLIRWLDPGLDEAERSSGTE